ncbi:MAG: hypothetical protein WCN21_13235 [Comamonadaceae bacterium]
MNHADEIWNKFCQRLNVVEQCVPLFLADPGGLVAHRWIGKGETARPVLMRSPQMEALIVEITRTLVDDWKSGLNRYDGMIYCMGWLHEKQMVPLYIGKAETVGKGLGNLSANLKNLATDRSKFARWGDNYAYHIGDLSACVLPGHALEKQTIKYKAWAERLFESTASLTPKLRRPTHFWATAWDKSMTCVWEELGPTSLAFLEYLLIGVAGRVSPVLLNREGISRGSM